MTLSLTQDHHRPVMRLQLRNVKEKNLELQTGLNLTYRQ